MHMDDLLAGLRQESSEDTLKASLDKIVHYVQDFENRYSRRKADAPVITCCCVCCYQIKMLACCSLLSLFVTATNNGTLTLAVFSLCVCVCTCSCSVFVSEQCKLLDRLPSLTLKELLSYSSSLSSFYHLNHTYRPVTMATTFRHIHLL